MSPDPTRFPWHEACLPPQQAAEKFIKAFLVRHQTEFPKSHDIALLRQLVARVDPRLAEKLATADALTPYGVEFRYPGDLPPVSRDEGKKALRLAEQTSAKVSGKNSKGERSTRNRV